MNILELVKSFFERGLKKRPTLPGWRHPGYSSRKSRTAFASTRERGPGKQEMHVEEFFDKAARNERFHQLRERGTRDLSKFSTVREAGIVDHKMTYKSVWCVVRP